MWRIVCGGLAGVKHEFGDLLWRLVAHLSGHGGFEVHVVQAAA